MNIIKMITALSLAEIVGAVLFSNTELAHLSNKENWVVIVVGGLLFGCLWPSREGRKR